MSEFKGTKGKWEVLNNDILTNFHTKIAKVHPVNLNDNLEHKYNALLISKAPEILEFLTQLQYACENGLIQDLEELGESTKELIKSATDL